MAVTYSSTVKDNRMTQVLNAIDGGSGAGYIEICSAAYASVLATITLSDPCGSVSECRLHPFHHFWCASLEAGYTLNDVGANGLG